MQGNLMNNLYKLYIGNLPWTIGSKELQHYFSKFGHISWSSVIYDKSTGISRGYGFITFSTRDAFNNAMKKNHHLEGRALKIEPAAKNA